jgi:hypothetical protein
VSGSFYVGLAVTSTYASRVVRANFTNTLLSLGTSSNQAPAVSLTSPAGSISITGPLALAATATDSDGSIASVAFYANTTLLATDTTSPYQATFSTSLPGVYAITAVAKDNVGTTTRSAARTVTVAGTTATVVTLTSPQDGGTYTAPAQIALAATATAAGGVQRVAFYANGTLLGTDTTSPYSWTWSNVPTGIYAVTAVAYDFAGAMTVSSTRDINVVAAGVPTTLKFAPASLLELVLRYVLEIFPAGANPATATPVATLDLGLPPIFSNEATVNIAPTINALPPGQYIATVSALRLLAPELQSPPSPTFTR